MKESMVELTEPHRLHNPLLDEWLLVSSNHGDLWRPPEGSKEARMGGVSTAPVRPSGGERQVARAGVVAESRSSRT
jgi:hypothetical protein